MKWCCFKIVCTVYFVYIQCIIQPDGEYHTDDNRSASQCIYWSSFDAITDKLQVWMSKITLSENIFAFIYPFSE